MDSCRCFSQKVQTCKYLLSYNLPPLPGILDMRKYDYNSFSHTLFEEDRVILRVKGDGNCLFRAVGAFLFHQEELHTVLRKRTCEFMRRNRATFSPYMNRGENFETHLKHMESTGGQISSWGSDVEIYAIATLFQCPIYVFCNYAGSFRWVKFNSLFETSTVPPVPYISIANTGAHYNAVLPTANKCVCTTLPPKLLGELESAENHNTVTIDDDDDDDDNDGGDGNDVDSGLEYSSYF